MDHKTGKINRTITFNKTGYDPFIDFMKAYAILCVLMGHTFPYLKASGYSLWYGMQVPLFVLVQVFHVLKKESYSFSVKKMLKRIVCPFLFIQLIPIGCELFSRGRSKDVIINWLMGGVRTGSLLSLDIHPNSSTFSLCETMVR